VLTVAILLSALNGSEPMDEITVKRGVHSWDLEWTDAEDRVYGFVTPLELVEGRPLSASLRVGTYQGTDMDGPLTASLRCADWSQSMTLQRAKDSKAFLAEFTPQGNGECRLEFGWQTTRHKVAHALLNVAPAPLSRAPWYVLIGLVAVVAFALGIRAALKRPD
jgi:hypothetical protein